MDDTLSQDYPEKYWPGPEDCSRRRRNGFGWIMRGGDCCCVTPEIRHNGMQHQFREVAMNERPYVTTRASGRYSFHENRHLDHDAQHLILLS